MYRVLLIAFLTATLFLLPRAVAADIAGKWELRGTSASGEEARVRLVITESGGKHSATLQVEGESIPVQGFVVAGDEVTFKIPTDDVTYTVKVTLKNDAAEGTYSASDGRSGKVSGKRI
jgi:hypothetical protein